MKKISEVSDEQLAGLIKKDPENLKEAIDRYWDRLFYFIKKVSYFDKDDIEDIVQNVFIKVYQKINAFDESMKFSSWIYQIARNAMIDEIRRKHARPQNISYNSEEILKITRSEIHIEKEFVNKEIESSLREMIKNLPLKYREVLVLRFLEEKDYEEIMDILKKPKGTVAAIINRGRKMIKEEALKLKLIE